MYIYLYIIYKYLLIKLCYLLTVLSWLSKLPHTHSNLLLYTCIIILLYTLCMQLHIKVCPAEYLLIVDIL